MSKRREKTPSKDIQIFVKAAKKSGYLVSGGINGGGWLRLAIACGYVEEAGKDGPKQFLRQKFRGIAITPAEKHASSALNSAKRRSGLTVDKSPDPIQTKTGVTSTDFLYSFEWRKLRMMALKKHGAKCQCCGATPATGAVMNVDHIKPRKFFPELALDLDNLQVLCGECNHGKGNWDTTDWRNRKNL